MTKQDRFIAFQDYLEDINQMKAFEQMITIKRIMTRNNFTHCDNCHINFISLSNEYDSVCPKCGGEV